MFSKQTIRDIDVRGKRILLRADYNVPVKDGAITNDYRIKQSLPTVQYLTGQGAKVIICSHLGRPDGKRDVAASLFPVAKRLDELMPDTKVSFVDDCVGDKVQAAASKLQESEVLLLENLRFYAEEEANDASFAEQLAGVADIFVQDGFGVVHRAHASTEGVTHFLPGVAGLLLEKEVGTITTVMEAPQRPLMAVIGGAKISDKIEIINRLIEIADFVAVGGAMANTFLKAQGLEVAKSLIDADDIPLAKQILAKAQEQAKKRPFVFYLPQDGVVATKLDSNVSTRIVDWSAHVISSIENYPKRPPTDASRMREDEMILDIGPFSAAFIAGAAQLSKTVLWNGTMGVTETPALQGAVGPFSHGSETIVQAFLGEFGTKPFTVVGGGDTVGYVENLGLVSAFNHVSTGGGASLELMSGRTLPGVAALHDKEPVNE
jgi:phosphoglycerate kinase